MRVWRKSHKYPDSPHYTPPEKEFHAWETLFQVLQKAENYG